MISNSGRAYYNEFDPYLCAWLQNLMDADLIAQGQIDCRSIKDVQPHDLQGFTQCHFFAGIGGWSLAARMAGWDDARPLWTGSPPCQPYSTAGKRAGADDPRNLWPDLYRLIDAERPAVFMGEQVSGADGYAWLDGVRADMEAGRYAFRAVDIAACAVDSPQQRNRLILAAVQMEIALGERGEMAGDGEGFGPADEGRALDGRAGPDGLDGGEPLDRPAGERRPQGIAESGARSGRRGHAPAGPDGQGALDHGERTGREGLGGHGDGAAGRIAGSVRSAPEADDRDGQGGESPRRRGASRPGKSLDRPEPFGRDAGRDDDGGYERPEPRAGDEIDGVAMADRDGVREFEPEGREREGGRRSGHRHGRNGSWWVGADWLKCHDDKARRVADATAPLLVNGIRGNVAIPRPLGLDPARFPEIERLVSRAGAWGGIGNAISPPLIAEAIGAMMDYLEEVEACRS